MVLIDWPIRASSEIHKVQENFMLLLEKFMNYFFWARYCNLPIEFTSSKTSSDKTSYYKYFIYT